MTLYNKIALYDSVGTLLDIHTIEFRLNNHKALYFRINFKKHHEFKCVPMLCETFRDITFYAYGYCEVLRGNLQMTDYIF